MLSRYETRKVHGTLIIGLRDKNVSYHWDTGQEGRVLYWDYPDKE